MGDTKQVGLLRKAMSSAARKTPLVKEVITRIRDTSQEVERLRIQCRQIEEAVNQSGLLPLPPEQLQRRVIGVYSPAFISSGDRVVDDLNTLLAKVGTSLQQSERILDFGCGPGRALRALHFRGLDKTRLFGSDIDPEAIEWCTQNYQRVATFSVNDHEPPTSYPNNFFDCVYSISVFTHLPEEMQFAWLAELRRITKPGGYLLLTVHGPDFEYVLSDAQKKTLSTHGFVYRSVGDTDGLPSFYQAAYHSHEYIKREWSKYFQIHHIEYKGVEAHQDVVLCQKSGS